MAMAETSQLLVELNLAGNFNQGIATAESRLGTFGAAVQTGTVKAASFASTMRTNVGGALSHAGGQIKNLVTGPLGLLGLGGALFTVGGAISHGLDRAREFGDEVRRLTALTGLSAETMSSLAAGLEHFGVDADKSTRLIGFLEKNVGLLAAKKDGIANFQKTFGLALTDPNGKLKDANELILTSADYFNNKSIPATTKAAALSKIYGRSWQDLIPVLKAGRQGLMDAEAEAKSLGLTLTGENVAALGKLKEATRDWNTALGGLELQIGLTLVPTITDLATHLTSFVRDHRTDIVQFFRDAAKFAGDAAGTIGRVAGSISSFWNGLPAGFRDLLVKGIVADRTIKFLFGFDPIKVGASLVTGPLTSLLSKLPGLGFLQRGSSPANPVYVSGVGLGGGTGAGAPGGLGLIGGLFALTAVAGIELAIADAVAPSFRKFLTGSDKPFAENPYYQDPANQTPYQRLRGGDPNWKPGDPLGPRAAPMRITNAGMSPDERQQHNDQVRVQAKLDALRDKIEANRIAVQGTASTTRHAIETTSAAEVRAIRAQKLAVTVNIRNTIALGSLAHARIVSATYSAGHVGADKGM